MQILNAPISLRNLQTMAKNRFGNLVKAVVDVKKEIMAIDAELHADEEAVLLDQGSKQENLWGINLYPDLFGKKDFMEFDSMINLRPSIGNQSRSIESRDTRAKILAIVTKLITL